MIMLLIKSAYNFSVRYKLIGYCFLVAMPVSLINKTYFKIIINWTGGSKGVTSRTRPISTGGMYILFRFCTLNMLLNM